MEELFYFKDKRGMWTCRDRAGRTAEGRTRDFARNQYYLQYIINREPEVPEVDITNYLHELNGED